MTAVWGGFLKAAIAAMVFVGVVSAVEGQEQPCGGQPARPRQDPLTAPGVAFQLCWLPSLTSNASSFAAQIGDHRGEAIDAVIGERYPIRPLSWSWLCPWAVMSASNDTRPIGSEVIGACLRRGNAMDAFDSAVLEARRLGIQALPQGCRRGRPFTAPGLRGSTSSGRRRRSHRHRSYSGTAVPPSWRACLREVWRRAVPAPPRGHSRSAVSAGESRSR